MSRRPATCFWSLVAGLAAVALAGCGGGAHEAPLPAPVAASTPAEHPQPAPAPAAAPAATATTEAAPVAANPTASAAQPSPSPEAAPADAVPPAAAAAAVPDPNAKPAAKPADAMQWMQDGEARRADHQRRLTESEASLTVANASVADWERTVLAFKNPFLPRPKLSSEDAQAVAGMDGGARLHWAEGRLAEARTARDTAQKSFDDLKANPPAD
jgi:hypothetical protein